MNKRMIDGIEVEISSGNVWGRGFPEACFDEKTISGVVHFTETI